MGDPEMAGLYKLARRAVGMATRDRTSARFEIKKWWGKSHWCEEDNPKVWNNEQVLRMAESLGRREVADPSSNTGPRTGADNPNLRGRQASTIMSTLFQAMTTRLAPTIQTIKSKKDLEIWLLRSDGECLAPATAENNFTAERSGSERRQYRKWNHARRATRQTGHVKDRRRQNQQSGTKLKWSKCLARLRSNLKRALTMAMFGGRGFNQVNDQREIPPKFEKVLANTEVFEETIDENERLGNEVRHQGIFKGETRIYEETDGDRDIRYVEREGLISVGLPKNLAVFVSEAPYVEAYNPVPQPNICKWIAGMKTTEAQDVFLWDGSVEVTLAENVLIRRCTAVARNFETPREAGRYMNRAHLHLGGRTIDDLKARSDEDERAGDVKPHPVVMLKMNMMIPVLDERLTLRSVFPVETPIVELFSATRKMNSVVLRDCDTMCGYPMVGCINCLSGAGHTQAWISMMDPRNLKIRHRFPEETSRDRVVGFSEEDPLRPHGETFIKDQLEYLGWPGSNRDYVGGSYIDGLHGHDGLRKNSRDYSDESPALGNLHSIYDVNTSGPTRFKRRSDEAKYWASGRYDVENVDHGTWATGDAKASNPAPAEQFNAEDSEAGEDVETMDTDRKIVVGGEEVELEEQSEPEASKPRSVVEADNDPDKTVNLCSSSETDRNVSSNQGTLNVTLRTGPPSGCDRHDSLDTQKWSGPGKVLKSKAEKKVKQSSHRAD